MTESRPALAASGGSHGQDNAGAQRFYASFGQSPDPTKLFYQLDGQVLLNMAVSLDGC
jgi:hypothetical protein